MKKIIIFGLMLFIISQDVISQSLDDTMSYLETMISSNPPLSNYEVEMNFHRPTNVKESEYFLYQKHVSNNLGGWAYSIGYYIDFRQMKNILVVKENQEVGTFYMVKIGLKSGKGSFVVSKSKLSGEKEPKEVTELKMFLPNDYNLASKIKKAFIHLGELSGIKVTDLDMF